ncbi:MAG TPA: hypothetical protein PLM75_06175 [bacterium]|nr:hypothetical protein [bacterium]HPP87429.1 hypothetical protein [bacterium]
MNDKYCIVVRYSAVYSEIVEKIVKETGAESFLLTKAVKLINKKINNMRPIKSVGLILIATAEQLSLFQKEFDNKISTNTELKQKIKYFVTHIYKEA